MYKEGEITEGESEKEKKNNKPISVLHMTRVQIQSCAWPLKWYVPKNY